MPRLLQGLIGCNPADKRAAYAVRSSSPERWDVWDANAKPAVGEIRHQLNRKNGQDEWQDDWDRGKRGPFFLAMDTLHVRA